MIENEISYIIRGAIYNVYNELVGLLESVYQMALMQVNETWITHRTWSSIPVYYDNEKLELDFP